MSNRVGLFLDRAELEIVETALKGHRSWLGGKYGKGAEWAIVEAERLDAVLVRIDEIRPALDPDDGSDLA
jgi:hypothetical protein